MNMKVKLQSASESGPRSPVESDAEIAAGFSALAHPARLAIVRRLACHDGCCCKEVVHHLDLAQSTVSQHLKVLVQAGLVDYEPNRQRSRYVLNKQGLRAVADAAQSLAYDCCNASPDASDEPI